MPTPNQLKSYASQLPQLYSDILLAFHRAALPYRKYGEGLSLDVLLTQLNNQGSPAAISDVYPALEQLEQYGFFQIDVQDLTYISPTPLGEELLEVVTGKKTPRVSVPELPKPTW